MNSESTSVVDHGPRRLVCGSRTLVLDRTLVPGVVAYFQLRGTVERWREERAAAA